MSWARSLHDIPIVDKKVVFSILRLTPRISPTYEYFSTENLEQFRYHPIIHEYGPPSISQIVEFIRYINNLMINSKKIIHYYSSDVISSKSLSFVYILCFKMFHMNISPKKTYSPYSQIMRNAQFFRDASDGPILYELHILEILKAIYKSVQIGWLDISTFNVDIWNQRYLTANGNISCIVPNKLYASSTLYSKSPLPGNIEVLTPEKAIPLYKEIGIKHIVRLNSPFYDSSLLTKEGFKYTCLEFADGSVPSDDIIDRFFSIMETNDTVLVHCKAGLGRTGTLVALYLIHFCGFSADEAIAWTRLCRPGSIIAQQQQFVKRFESDHAQSEPKQMTQRIAFTNTVFNPQKGFFIDTNDVLDFYHNGPKYTQNLVTKRTFTPGLIMIQTSKF